LHIQPLNIIRADKDFAYVVSGLDDEAIIVTSSLDVVTDGDKVRTSADREDEAVNADSNKPGGPEAK